MLKMSISPKVNKVFFRFMISYLIILLLTILIGSFVYNEALKMAKKDAVEGGLASLEKGKELLDARFTEVNSIIDQLAINQEIRDIFNMSAPIKLIDYYKLRKAFSRISTYRVTNNFIDDLYIYANDANVLVSMSYISVRMPDFYQNFLKYV